MGNMVHTGSGESNDFILALISKRIECDYSILEMCYIDCWVVLNITEGGGKAVANDKLAAL